MSNPTSSAATKAAASAAQKASALASQAATNPAAMQKRSNKSELRALVNDNDIVKTQFRNALGKHADTFLASIIDLYNSDSALMQCSPSAVVAECLKAATLRLPINKQLGFAYVIAFNNSKRNPDGSYTKVMEPTFQIGYKGYIQLAMRSGQYACLNSDVVFEGELVGKNKLTGEIDVSGTKTSDKVIGYLAYERLNNGFSKTLYMSVEEMANHAKRYSKGVGFNTTVEQLLAAASAPFDPNSKSVGWLGNFHAMALKTAIRQMLSKWGNLSVEMNNAMAQDIDSDSSLEGNDGTTEPFDTYEELPTDTPDTPDTPEQ